MQEWKKKALLLLQPGYVEEEKDESDSGKCMYEMDLIGYRQSFVPSDCITGDGVCKQKKIEKIEKIEKMIENQ